MSVTRDPPPPPPPRTVHVCAACFRWHVFGKPTSIREVREASGAVGYKVRRSGLGLTGTDVGQDFPPCPLCLRSARTRIRHLVLLRPVVVAPAPSAEPPRIRGRLRLVPRLPDHPPPNTGMTAPA